MVRSACLFLFLFLCSYIEAGTPRSPKEKLQRMKEAMKSVCKLSSGVPQDALDEMKNGNYPENRKLKCYVRCCLEMMRTMKGGAITVPEATKQIEALLPEDMKEASLRQLNSCKDSDGADACDKAFNFVKCAVKVEPNNVLIPT